MLTSEPIITVDYFRYLWDGATVAHGINPYLYTPNQILQVSEALTEIPKILLQLSHQRGSTLSMIIFPDIRTPYPPLAQLFFALSFKLKPWSLTAWRLILFTFDIITLILIYRILTLLSKSAFWVSIYWLNPLLIKEITNSGHLDILVIPFILGGILLLIREKYYIAIFSLALAVGIKIWPIVLLPIFIKPLLPSFKKVIYVIVLFASLCLIIFYPVYTSGIDSSLGLLAYAKQWEYNDSFFKLILFLSRTILSTLNVSYLYDQNLARILITILFFIWVVYVLKQKGRKPNDLLQQCALTIAGLLLLSPTLFPWYFAWLIPFLVFYPIKPLFLLTLLSPVYYIRFYFFSLNRVELFDNYIVWIQYLPVWALIAYQLLLNYRISLDTEGRTTFET
jgi:hypothetical protein